MEVILLERVEKLGQMGEIVKVKPGYARNYLLPQKKALRATEENRSYFDDRRAQLEAENLEKRKDAETVAEKMDGLSVVMVRAAGDSGQLYGSVSTRDISNAVTEAGFTVERQQVMLDTPIKSLGLFPVRLRLHPEVVVEVTVNVARSEAEAEIQASTGKVAARTEDEVGEILPDPDPEAEVAPAAIDEDAVIDVFEIEGPGGTAEADDLAAVGDDDEDKA